MDAVFPSHNVSESLPKETTASPITLSNRISQEMYRLHRLVPLAKRINEKSYNTTLPFPHRANQTYLITNCYKPRNKLLSLYGRHTVRQPECSTSAPVSSTIRSATVCVSLRGEVSHKHLTFFSRIIEITPVLSTS